MNKILVIDGTNLIHRNYYVFKNMINKKGINIGALYGTIRSLKKYIYMFNPKQIFICFDKGRKTFRHKFYPEYKRGRKETDIDLKNQFGLFEEFCNLANIPFVKKDLYEADDLVGSLSYNSVKYNLIPYAISGDKDIFQLLDKDINIYYLSSKGNRIYEKQDFIKEFRIKPSQYVDYKAVVGDTSNGIPGIRGIGKKTAEKLFNSYENLNDIYKNIESLNKKQKEKILEDKEDVFLYQKIIPIKYNIELDYDKYFIEKIKEGFDLHSIIYSLKMMELNQ